MIPGSQPVHSIEVLAVITTIKESTRQQHCNKFGELLQHYWKATEQKKKENDKVCTFINISSYSIYILYICISVVVFRIFGIVRICSVTMACNCEHTRFVLLSSSSHSARALGVYAPEPCPAAIFFIVVCSGAKNCT